MVPPSAGAPGQAVKGFYLSLSLWMLNRIASHMSGRWYLAMFLLMEGSLTL